MAQNTLHNSSGAGISRRRALALTATGVAGAVLGVGFTDLWTRLIKSNASEYIFFSPSDAELVIDICERIIPRDDCPGATDAGVIYYIDRQVGAGMLVKHQQAYRRGLESFRHTCDKHYAKPFGALPTDAKIALLEQIDAGRMDPALWGDPAQDAFFRMVVDHTMQGFYGSPRHGGNRDFVSYRMLGLDYPQVLGQNRHGGATS